MSKPKAWVAESPETVVSTHTHSQLSTLLLTPTQQYHMSHIVEKSKDSQRNTRKIHGTRKQVS